MNSMYNTTNITYIFYKNNKISRRKKVEVHNSVVSRYLKTKQIEWRLKGYTVKHKKRNEYLSCVFTDHTYEVFKEKTKVFELKYTETRKYKDKNEYVKIHGREFKFN